MTGAHAAIKRDTLGGSVHLPVRVSVPAPTPEHSREAAGQRSFEQEGSQEALEDIVGDRFRLIGIGMAAVAIACAIFAAFRLIVQIETGHATPWWGNAAGAVALTLLYVFYRGDRRGRSSYAVHGTAAIATIALLVPCAYGMESSKWWLALVGFSTLLMGRRKEGLVWSIVT
jgi:hypothetical protein